MVCDYFFFFNDTATTEIYTLSLHDALPIYSYIQMISNARKKILYMLDIRFLATQSKSVALMISVFWVLVITQADQLAWLCTICKQCFRWTRVVILHKIRYSATHRIIRQVVWSISLRWHFHQQWVRYLGLQRLRC